MGGSEAGYHIPLVRSCTGGDLVPPVAFNEIETLALRLRKWGGGGEDGISPPFILRAGWRLELEC